jgi:hypothetical protein
VGRLPTQGVREVDPRPHECDRDLSPIDSPTVELIISSSRGDSESHHVGPRIPEVPVGHTLDVAVHDDNLNGGRGLQQCGRDNRCHLAWANDGRLQPCACVMQIASGGPESSAPDEMSEVAEVGSIDRNRHIRTSCCYIRGRHTRDDRRRCRIRTATSIVAIVVAVVVARHGGTAADCEQ